MSELSENEVERFSRQLLLKNWSSNFQLSIRNSHLALPSHLVSAAFYFAALGVGKITFLGEQNDSTPNHIRRFDPKIDVEFSQSIPISANCIISEGSIPPSTSDKFTAVIDAQNQTLSTHLDGVSTEYPLETFEQVDINLPAGTLTCALFLEWWKAKRQ